MNRTSTLNHASQSDAAYEAGHFEPLPSTLDTIAAIRKQNEVWRLEAEREEIRAAPPKYQLECQPCGGKRFDATLDFCPRCGAWNLRSGFYEEKVKQDKIDLLSE